VLTRHAWGDFGRLYALLFLVITGPAILVALIGSVSAAFFPFDARLIMETHAGEPLWVLSEGDLMNKVMAGEIRLPPNVAQNAAWILAVNGLVSLTATGLFLVCLTRLVPYFFWRSGGPVAATLAQTWRGVGWGHAVLFGAVLTGVLVILYRAALPTALSTTVFVAFILIWAWILAQRVGRFVDG